MATIARGPVNPGAATKRPMPQPSMSATFVMTGLSWIVSPVVVAVEPYWPGDVQTWPVAWPIVTSLLKAIACFCQIRVEFWAATPPGKSQTLRWLSA